MIQPAVADVRIPRANAVILVRHGRTALNADGRIRGRLDPELDHEGRREVSRLAAFLADKNIVRVLASPLTRAQQTARMIVDRHGGSVAEAGVRTAAGLSDRDYGSWSGHREAELIDHYGSLDRVPDVEPSASVSRRARRVLEDQRPLLGEGCVVLVSHDAVNRTLLADLLQGTDDGPIEQHTACWNLILLEPSRWRPVAVNRYRWAESDRVSTWSTSDEQGEDTADAVISPPQTTR
ncbi:histidine phosphatase family protein [Microlunatus elymi]|uniref:Histidine phosphatase family protein n=1 Tax=Microlunatus elymi TaxID=2596828 RepID=A0A516PYE0_9ACTN|nr:histidine phosphatase family protein [Microlunatus elymi]QDP95991.1 histidine phosphatase family protein [Microlunatus elymi]